MKKLDYERLKSSIESQKKLVEKGEEDLKKEFADKDKYYNEIVEKSNSVDEIAFGIMAEILLVKNKGSLKHRREK